MPSASAGTTTNTTAAACNCLELALGQIFLAQSRIRDGIVLPGAGHLQRVGRQAQEHLSRERVVTRMQLLDGSR